MTHHSGHYDHFKTTDLQVVFAFAAAYPFAALCKNGLEGVPEIVSAPLIITSNGKDFEFHMARANPAFAAFEAGGPVRALLRGPNAHISPAWYKARWAGGGNRAHTAPTWNYMEARITGEAIPMTEVALKNHLKRLVTQFEKTVPGGGWSLDEIDPEKFQKWAAMIAGFSIKIKDVSAVFKCSQEQGPDNIPAVAEGLRMRNQGFDDLLAAEMLGNLYGFRKDG